MSYLKYIKKNQDERFKRLVTASRFQEKKPKRFVSLVFRAIASDIITTSKAASLLNISIEDVRNRLNLI